MTKVCKYEKQRAQEKFKMKYFTSVAHDLRTPINTVTQINKELLELVPNKHKKMVEISEASCRFFFATMEDIFDISRLELGDFTLNKSWFLLKEVFDEVY